MGESNPIRGIFAGFCWATLHNGAAIAPAPSATTSLRRLFILPPNNLRIHYAKSHEGQQVCGFLGRIMTDWI